MRRKKTLKKRIVAAVVSGVLAFGLTGCTQGGIIEEKSTTEAQNLEDVSFDIRPQDDYYGYINANDLWVKEIDYGENTAGSFDDLQDEVVDCLKEILQEILTSEEVWEPGSPQQLIRDYYYQCKEPKKDYTKEFDAVFAMIDGAKTVDDLVSVSTKLSLDYGVTPLFAVTAAENYYRPGEYCLNFSTLDTPFSLKDVSEKPRSQQEVRDELAEYLRGFGVEYDEATQRANAILYWLIDMAAKTDFAAMESFDVERVTNIYTKGELASLLSNIDAEKMLTGYGITNVPNGEYNVKSVGQMEVLNSYLTPENLPMFKDYFKCRFVMGFESLAPAAYLNYEPDTSIPMDEQIAENTIETMVDQFDELYCQRYYTEEYQAAMERLEKDIRKAYVEMINQADWLSEEGRAGFVEKFNNITFYFGGQESFEHSPADAKLIGKNAFETQCNFAKKGADKWKKNLTSKTDNTKWNMPSCMVNAYYSPSANSIYITRAIMGAPFYDINGDYYANLGGLGAVIGHELSHAFDSMGVKFDANGAYNPDWVSKEDQEAFEQVKEQVKAFYDEQTLLDVYHVDGEQTLGENLADLGGVECMLRIAKTPEQKEKLFETYGKIWCVLYPNTSVISALTTDEHSPDLVRVNAVLSNFDDFYDVYDVKEGDGMYVPPEERVVRW